MTEKTKVNLKYELEDYENNKKKTPAIDMKGIRVADEEGLKEIIDKIPESVRFKFRKEVHNFKNKESVVSHAAVYE